MAETIAGVTVPDSRMARETTDFICDTESPLLYHHSRRTYLFGMLHGQLRGQTPTPNCSTSRRCSTTSDSSRDIGTSASDSRSTAPTPRAISCSP